MKPRKNETTAVNHREVLEDIVPVGVHIEDWKEWREKYNAASRLEVQEFPPQINVELTGACNYKCQFCVQSYMDRTKGEIRHEDFKKIINEAVSLGTRSLKLSNWNEPLLHNYLEDYILYARKAGIFNVYISSNGSLLSKDRAESLIEAGLTKIFISLDATNEETYYRQRGQRNYKKVVENIMNLIEIRGKGKFPIVRVNFLKTEINRGQEGEFVRMWEGIADIVGIQIMNELPDKESGVQREEDRRESYRCSFPFKQLVVNHAGQILPCCVMYGAKMPLGNIADMTLKEAWNSQQMKDLQKLHFEGRFAENPYCRRCISGK